MAEIRDLDELVPDDIEYRFRGKTYVLPGDIDVQHTYELLGMLVRQGDIEKASNAGETEIDNQSILDAKRVNDQKIEAALLTLFQERDPTLERLPFGVRGMQAVLADVLIAMGFQFAPAEEEGSSPPATARTRSGRSTSSPRSSRSSGSRTPKS